jgi:hypothetical protein
MSGRHVNSVVASLRGFQIARGLCAKPPARARVSPVDGPAWAEFSPALFILFFFLFLPSLEIYWKF